MISRSAILSPPIEPGSNAKETEFTRLAWIGGATFAATVQHPCAAGFLFMVRKETKEIILTSEEVSEFFQLVRASSVADCWLWIGKRNKNKNPAFDYGFFKKHLLAHRVMWTIVNGPIPSKQVVRHSCDNPPCCNPFHLLCGTQAQNIRDMHRRNRVCRGENRKNSKLTDEKVRALREFYRLNMGPYRVFKYRVQIYIKDLGVNITTAHRAATGKTWQHIEAPVRIPGYRTGRGPRKPTRT